MMMMMMIFLICNEEINQELKDLHFYVIVFIYRYNFNFRYEFSFVIFYTRNSFIVI